MESVLTKKCEKKKQQHWDNIFERYKLFDKKPSIFGMLGGAIFKLFRYLQDIMSIIHTKCSADT